MKNNFKLKLILFINFKGIIPLLSNPLIMSLRKALLCVHERGLIPAWTGDLPCPTLTETREARARRNEAFESTTRSTPSP